MESRSPSPPSPWGAAGDVDSPMGPWLDMAYDCARAAAEALEYLAELADGAGGAPESAWNSPEGSEALVTLRRGIGLAYTYGRGPRPYKRRCGGNPSAFGPSELRELRELLELSRQGARLERCLVWCLAWPACRCTGRGAADACLERARMIGVVARVDPSLCASTEVLGGNAGCIYMPRALEELWLFADRVPGAFARLVDALCEAGSTPMVHLSTSAVSSYDRTGRSWTNSPADITLRAVAARSDLHRVLPGFLEFHSVRRGISSSAAFDWCADAVGADVVAEFARSIAIPEIPSAGYIKYVPDAPGRAKAIIACLAAMSTPYKNMVSSRIRAALFGVDAPTSSAAAYRMGAKNRDLAALELELDRLAAAVCSACRPHNKYYGDKCAPFHAWIEAREAEAGARLRFAE